MIRFIKRFFEPSVDHICENVDIYSFLLNLQDRIKKLEIENVELTNALYECENRLQSQIDNIHPVVYNLENFKLER
jgi:hypothetical protein